MDEDHRQRSALVLGHGTRSFLTAIRSLGRAGVEVHVGWHDPSDPSMRSRYIHKAHELPPYSWEADAWKTALIELMQRERFDLVVPCHDQVLIPLQAHRAELETYGRIYVLHDGVFDVLVDKLKTAELAASAGVPSPQTVAVHELSDIQCARETLHLPVVLKPSSTYDLRTIPERHGIRMAESWDEAERGVAKMLEVGPVAAQEYVPGIGVGVDLLMHDGEPLLAFQHARVHELPHDGSSYRASVPLQRYLLDASVRLLKPLRYTGVAMVEFRVNRETGEWALMEVNPRFWGSIPLSVAAGADFPAALFGMLVEGRTRFDGDYRPGIYCRNLSLDLKWLEVTADEAHSVGRSRVATTVHVLGQAALNVVTLQERSDTLVWDDPLPGLAEIVQILKDGWTRMVTRAFQRTSERETSRQRARQALQGAENLLFVCYGNICRSPFAEYFARKRFPEKRVASTGYHPKPNRPSPPDAVEVASEWGVDLTPHRSSILSAGAVRDADAIFVFDEENFRKVVSDYPDSRDRVHFVGALSPDGKTLVPDPWGKDAGFFRQTYEQIAEALEAVPSDEKVGS